MINLKLCKQLNFVPKALRRLTLSATMMQSLLQTLKLFPVMIFPKFFALSRSTFMDSFGPQNDSSLHYRNTEQERQVEFILLARSQILIHSEK